MRAMTVVYGTVCLDLTYRVPQVPPKGGYVEIAQEQRALGGEAANTAAALCKWGAECALVGNSIGTGAEADEVKRALLDHGISYARCPDGDHPAPVCHILVTPDGERTMFGRGFLEMEQRSDTSLVPHSAGSWFTADPNHGAAARRAMQEAHSAGMSCYALDLVRDDDDLPPNSFWQSSTSWVGASGDWERNTRWLQDWLDKHDVTAVLTDSDGGFLVGTRQGGIRQLPPYPAGRVVDTTGAGDVFRAGMLFCLERRKPLAECLKFAAAAAALNCEGLGAIGALPSREQVESLVAEHPGIAAKYDEGV
jgi:sugar/nucleoside kinase (ribokinase family)